MKSKKILSGLLAAALAFGTTAALPTDFADIAVTASAETTKDGFILDVDSDGLTYVSGYEGKGGAVTIPEEAAYVFFCAFNDNITSVTIPKTCYLGIGNGAFRYCSKLKKVVFEGDIGYVGNGAFEGCTNLEEVVFKGDVYTSDPVPDLDYNYGGIGYSAFADCSSLKKVTFSKSNAKVNYIGYGAFSGCISLTSINLPTGLGELQACAFLNCVSLKSVTFPEKTKFENSEEAGSEQFGYAFGYKSKSDADSNAQKVLMKMDGNTTVWLEVASAGGKTSIVGYKPSAPTMYVTKGSDAEAYAIAHGIAYKYGSVQPTTTTTTKTTAPASNLAAPANVKSSPAADSVTLSWDKVSGAERYRIYVYNSSTGKYEKWRSVTETSAFVGGLKSGTEYKIKVVAVETKNGSYVEGKAKTFSVTTK